MEKKAKVVRILRHSIVVENCQLLVGRLESGSLGSPSPWADHSATACLSTLLHIKWYNGHSNSRDLGVCSYVCVCGFRFPNRVLGFISRGVRNKRAEVFLTFYMALVRLQLGYAVEYVFFRLKTKKLQVQKKTYIIIWYLLEWHRLWCDNWIFKRGKRINKGDINK